MNGFCIGFSGKYNEIEMGWYQNDVVHGNWMKIKGDDMSVIESGYYADDIRKDDMRNDRYNKPFTIYDIFADEDLPSAAFDAKNIAISKP